MMLLKMALYCFSYVLAIIMIANTQRYEQKYLGLPH
jgi:hypothetical protein